MITRMLFLSLLLVTNLSFSKEILLTKDNTIVFNTPFDGAAAARVIEEAKALDANANSDYPIYLFLDTPGGSIQAGLEIIEAMKGLNRPVHTITLFAASMGWQLLQHLDKRYVLEYSILMSHKASGGFRGEFGGGFSQLDSRYGMWLKRIDLMDKKTVERTNGKKTLQQYRSEYDNELWLNGAEAVESGYADEVVTVKCDSTLSGKKADTVNYFGMTISIEKSNCPISTGVVITGVNIRTNKGSMEFETFLAEGGKFGGNCNKNQVQAVTNSFGEVIQEGKESEICALDESLTFDKVTQIKMDTIKNSNKRHLSSPIHMSFTSQQE